MYTDAESISEGLFYSVVGLDACVLLKWPTAMCWLSAWYIHIMSWLIAAVQLPQKCSGGEIAENYCHMRSGLGLLWELSL